MPRIRRVVTWLVCAGAGFAIVRFVPTTAAWQSRRQALQVESLRVNADSLEITLRNPAPSISFLTTLDMEVTTLGGAHTARCSLTLSQLVDPRSLHRVVLAAERTGPPAPGEYDVTFTLRYNEASTLPLGRLQLAGDAPPCGWQPVRVERARLSQS